MILDGQASFSPAKQVFAHQVAGPAEIDFSANQKAVLRALEDDARSVRSMPLDDG